MHELENNVEPRAQIPVGSALIVDILLQDLLHMAISCRYLRVDFVSDQYPVQIIKNCERERLAMSSIQVIPIKRPDQKTPKQLMTYLTNGKSVGICAILEH